MLKLTSYNGKPVMIMVAHITFVRPSYENGAYVNFIGGFAKVRNTYEEVLRLVGYAINEH